MNLSSSENDKYLLSSLSNALDLLNELASQPDMGITELSKRLHLGKSSVFRTLYTLEKKGFVQKTTDSRYSLGIKLAILGRIAGNLRDDSASIHYILEDLAQKTSMTVYLSILAGNCDMVFIDCAFGSALLQFRAKPGSRYPAYCSGGGKVLLSYLLDTERESSLDQIELLPRTATTITDVRHLRKVLRNIRKTGYGVDDGEGESELICYGMPVLDRTGNCLCSLSVSGPKQTMIENREHFLNCLQISAKNLTACSELLEQYIGYYSDIYRI